MLGVLKHLNAGRVVTAATALGVIVPLLYPLQVAALSADQKKLFDQGIYYFNAANDTTTAGGGTGSCGPDNITLTGSTNRMKIMNFLVDTKGLSPTQAAGIAGNISVESAYEQERLQGTDIGVVTPAETLTPSQLTDHNLGWGLVQWTPPGKMISTFSPVTDANDLGNQLIFLWNELAGSQILTDIESVPLNDIQNAVLAFQGDQGPPPVFGGQYYGYERPQNESASVRDRVKAANAALAAYGNGGTTGGGTTGSGCTGSGGIGGSGSGKFTTNTSLPAYPNLDKMLAYAQQVAQTSIAPLPPATQAFCNAIGGCASRCESAVEQVWLGHTKQYPNPYSQPPNGQSAWEVISAAGHAHPGDRNPPIGALLIYTSPGNPLGHVAVYVGNNLVFSTDLLQSGSVYIGSADKIESGGWNFTYIGWADPYSHGGLW